MKTNSLLALLLSGSLLVVGCSKEDDPIEPPKEDPVEVPKDKPDETTSAYTSNTYVLRWNKSNSTYEIHEVTFKTSNHDAVLTPVGSSSQGVMASKYDVKEINYDEKNNQFVALHKYDGSINVLGSYENLWVYDVASKSDKLIKLPEISEGDRYRDLVITKEKALVLKWNGINTSYEIHEVDLSNGSLKLVGASSTGTMSHWDELREIEFDENNNRALALRQGKDIWVYDLTSKIEQITSLPELPSNNDRYQDVHATEDKILLLKWNHGATAYEIHEVDLKSSTTTLMGASSKYEINSSSALTEINFDQKNNRVVALHGNFILWYYDFTRKISGLRNMPVINSDLSSYSDLVIFNKKKE